MFLRYQRIEAAIPGESFHVQYMRRRPSLQEMIKTHTDDPVRRKAYLSATARRQEAPLVVCKPDFFPMVFNILSTASGYRMHGPSAQ